MLFGFLAGLRQRRKVGYRRKMVVTGTVTSKLALDNPRVVATDDLGYRVWTYLDSDLVSSPSSSRPGATTASSWPTSVPTARDRRSRRAPRRGFQDRMARVPTRRRESIPRLRVSGAASATATVGTLSRGGYGGCDACGDNSGSGRGGYGGGADDDEDDDKSEHDDDKDCHDESESSSGYGGGSSANEGSGYGGGGGSSGRGGHGGADSDDDDDDGDKKCDVCAGARETELEPSKPVGAECADKGHKERKSKGGYGDQRACPLANKPPPTAKPEPPKPAGSSCAQTSQCASACACVAATCETIN